MYYVLHCNVNHKTRFPNPYHALRNIVANCKIHFTARFEILYRFKYCINIIHLKISDTNACKRSDYTHNIHYTHTPQKQN